MQSAVTCGLSIISIEDEFREAGKDIALTTEENHFQVLKMLDKVHSSMHKMQQALVDKFVLVLDNLNHTLLNCQCHWNLKYLFFTFMALTIHNDQVFTFCTLLSLIELSFILNKYSIESLSQYACFILVVIFPLGPLLSCFHYLLFLMFQVPCLSLTF